MSYGQQVIREKPRASGTAAYLKSSSMLKGQPIWLKAERLYYVNRFGLSNMASVAASMRACSCLTWRACPFHSQDFDLQKRKLLALPV